jgi:hypothetical protein
MKPCTKAISSRQAIFQALFSLRDFDELAGFEQAAMYSDGPTDADLGIVPDETCLGLRRIIGVDFVGDERLRLKRAIAWAKPEGTKICSAPSAALGTIRRK